jgi:hypothetical protein
VTSGTNSVANTGLQKHTVINYTEAAIQEWNEASGFNRKLYFAGEKTAQDSPGNGITVYATICGSTACGAEWLAK